MRTPMPWKKKQIHFFLLLHIGWAACGIVVSILREAMFPVKTPSREGEWMLPVPNPATRESKQIH